MRRIYTYNISYDCVKKCSEVIRSLGGSDESEGISLKLSSMKNECKIDDKLCLIRWGLRKPIPVDSIHLFVPGSPLLQ